MPYRTVKPVSERGSIQDLAKRHTDNLTENPATGFETRLAALYERGVQERNVALIESTGFIVMNNPGDKSAYPITLLRHREKVNEIIARRSESIKELSQEIAPVLSITEEQPTEIVASLYKSINARNTILESRMTKTASVSTSKRSFRRVV